MGKKNKNKVSRVHVWRRHTNPLNVRCSQAKKKRKKSLNKRAEGTLNKRAKETPQAQRLSQLHAFTPEFEGGPAAPWNSTSYLIDNKGELTPSRTPHYLTGYEVDASAKGYSIDVFGSMHGKIVPLDVPEALSTDDEVSGSDCRVEGYRLVESAKPDFQGPDNLVSEVARQAAYISNLEGEVACLKEKLSLVQRAVTSCSRLSLSDEDSAKIVSQISQSRKN